MPHDPESLFVGACLGFLVTVLGALGFYRVALWINAKAR